MRNPRKFWIVNGFACEARLEAIEELVREDAISYVYLDRFAFDSFPHPCLCPSEKSMG